MTNKNNSSNIDNTAIDKEFLNKWLRENIKANPPTSSQRQKLREVFAGKRTSYHGWFLGGNGLLKKVAAKSNEINSGIRKKRSDAGKLRGLQNPYKVWIDKSQMKLRIALDMESNKINFFEIHDSYDERIDENNVEVTCEYLSELESEIQLTIHDEGSYANRLMLPEDRYGNYGVGTLHWSAYATYMGHHFSQEDVAIIPKYGTDADDYFGRIDHGDFDIQTLLDCKIKITWEYDPREQAND